MKTNIQDIEKIGNITEDFRNLFNVDGVMECILSVDAASLDRLNQKGHSYVFVFIYDLYNQPINVSRFSGIQRKMVMQMRKLKIMSSKL